MRRTGILSVLNGSAGAPVKGAACVVLLSILLVFVLNISPSRAAPRLSGAGENTPAIQMSDGFDPAVKLPAALVLDTSLRSELYKRNIDLVLEIPAVSRLMTLYLVSERLSADDMIPITREAAYLAQAETDITIPLREGDLLPVRYLLLRMMFQNSDAAAAAFAEKIAGTKQQFIAEMQKTASMLGMNQTVFFALDVAKAERDSDIPYAVTKAITVLDSHNEQDSAGAPPLPEADSTVSTAATTLHDLARLFAAIQANARAKNILATQEELIQISLSTNVHVVAMRSPSSRLWTLSENRITGAWQMMSNRYSLAVSVGTTPDGISMMALTASLRQANMTQTMLQLYQKVNQFYTKSVLTRAGDKYRGAPEEAENGELFSLIYLDSIDYVHPKTDHFLLPKLDYHGNAPYPLPILKGAMTGQVIFTLKDGTRIPVRVGAESDILASNNILSRGIQQMARNPNLAYSIVLVAGILTLSLLIVIVRELKRLLYWRRLRILEDTVQSAHAILVGERTREE